MQSSHLKKIKIPAKAGVYFFRNKNRILYIGKATSLRERTKSYFAKDLIATRGPLILDMVFKATTIDWQETDTVLEAIILEANLIKKYQPYYNTREKDDKSFNYVCITKPARLNDASRSGGEKLPKVVLARGHNLGKGAYRNVFGPFTSGMQLREALKIIRKIFPFLDDKNKDYLEFYKQINLAPDVNDRKLYLQNIKNIKLFFEGKKKRILKNLQRQMKEYARKREFERAGEVKRQIFALQHINDVALLGKGAGAQEHALRHSHSVQEGKYYSGRSKDSSEHVPALPRIEAYDIAHMGGRDMTGVMVVVENGEVAKNEYRKFKIRTQSGANDTGALKEVLERRFKHTEWSFPDLVVVDGSTAQINITQTVLAKLNLKIPVVAVVKDERHKPKAIMGSEEYALKYKKEILLANSEAHRFAINYHKNMRGKNFLNR